MISTFECTRREGLILYGKFAEMGPLWDFANIILFVLIAYAVAVQMLLYK